MQTKLLSRLERIFEACFPPVTVSEMEEEIAPLNLLLEMGNKPRRTEETLSQRYGPFLNVIDTQKHASFQ